VGRLDLVARINSDGAIQECDFCDSNNEQDGERYFERPTTLDLVPVRVVRSDGTAVNPADIDALFTALRRTYPLTTLNRMPTRTLNTNRTDGDLLELIADRFTCFPDDIGDAWDWLVGCEWNRYFVGIVAANSVVGCPGGLAYVSSPVSWSEASTWIVAEEVGHMLGRRHAGNAHDEASGGGFDAAYPYPDGKIGDHGFDTTAMRAIPTDPPYPPWGIPTVPSNPDCDRQGTTEHAHDFMSYGEDGPYWISDYTHDAIFRSGFRGSAGGLKSVARGKKGNGSEPRISKSMSDLYLFASGKILEDGSMELDPIHVARLPEESGVYEGEGPYTIELVDGSGATRLAGNFDERNLQDGKNEHLFRVVVPWDEDTAWIRFLDDTGVRAQRMVSANPPTVTVVAPNGDEVWPSPGEQTIQWTADDADGDPLTFNVHYSADGGNSWSVVASRLETTSHDIEVAELAGSEEAMVRVVVTDGVNTSMDASDGPFKVEGSPPYVVIYSPAEAARVPRDATLILEGGSTDTEDGVLAEDFLFWSCDVHGSLGSGRRLDLVGLVQGTHEITLEVIDSDGMTGSATITVDIMEPLRLLEVLRLGDGAGAVTTDPVGVDCGEICESLFSEGSSITLNATPAPGSVFAGWGGDDDCLDGEVLLVDTTVCTARFDPLPPVKLTVTLGGTGSGRVTSDPPGIDCGSDCDELYPVGTAVTLTATPDLGSTFVGWSGDLDCADGIVTLDQDQTCHATFNLGGPTDLIFTDGFESGDTSAWSAAVP
jgi:hypothetical protein